VERKELGEYSIKRVEDLIERALLKYPKALRAWTLIKADHRVLASWEMANYLATRKMKYNVHDDTHAKMVALNALRMLEFLEEANVKPDAVKDGYGDPDDARLIVLLAALLHDIGNQVDRDGHNMYSVVLSNEILEEILSKIYEDSFKRTIIKAFILHAIHTHMEETKSRTIEASVVKVADGTDMTKGRSRLPYDMGNVNIHTVSALSIERVEIVRGSEKPVEIRVYMTNSAGIFQVEEILYRKLESSVIFDYVDIIAITIPEEASVDKRLVRKIVTMGGKLEHLPK